MTSHEILLLDKIAEEAINANGQGLLFGTTNLFRDRNERFNFLFHYVSGRPKPHLPDELTLVPVSPYRKIDQSRMWMYELNRNLGLEQFALREGDQLGFYETKPVSSGTEIIPITRYALVNRQKIIQVEGWGDIEKEIEKLHHIASDYAASR